MNSIKKVVSRNQVNKEIRKILPSELSNVFMKASSWIALLDSSSPEVLDFDMINKHILFLHDGDLSAVEKSKVFFKQLSAVGFQHKSTLKQKSYVTWEMNLYNLLSDGATHLRVFPKVVFD